MDANNYFNHAMEILASDLHLAGVKCEQLILETRPPIGMSVQLDEGKVTKQIKNWDSKQEDKNWDSVQVNSCSKQSTWLFFKNTALTLLASVSLEDLPNPAAENFQRLCKMISRMRCYGIRQAYACACACVLLRNGDINHFSMPLLWLPKIHCFHARNKP